MTSRLAGEIQTCHERYLAARARIEAGQLGWDALADFFTEDATFIDPAWGRVEGLANIRKFLVESMAGLEDWRFPHQWHVIEDARLVSHFFNRLPGRRADGSFYEAPGVSIFEYAGDGRFRFEMDLLNMAHVNELIRESGWRPPASFNAPPRHPRR
ncbi:MAG: nuclear transport factor 2 family protein [Myxococcota bacterium]